MASRTSSLRFLSLLVFSYDIVQMAMAGDPDIITDFIVPPNENGTLNGNFFTYTGFRALVGGGPPTPLNVMKASLAEFPALNGQSVSYAVLQFPNNGTTNPPHTHPRSAELLFLVGGCSRMWEGRREQRMRETSESIRLSHLNMSCSFPPFWNFLAVSELDVGLRRTRGMTLAFGQLEIQSLAAKCVALKKDMLVFDDCSCSVLLLVGFPLVIVAPEKLFGCFFTPIGCLWSKLLETLEEFVRANLLSSAKPNVGGKGGAADERNQGEHSALPFEYELLLPIICNNPILLWNFLAVSELDVGLRRTRTVSIPSTLFTTGIDDNVLAISFKTDAGTIQKLKAGLAIRRVA
ncbi:unnamed protein product [Malus baccata var. baccata]